MTDGNLFGLRALTDEETNFLTTRKFYTTALINKFLDMKRDAAALDLPSKAEATKLAKKLNAIISRAGLNSSLGCYVRDSTLYLHTTRKGAIDELPESVEAAIRKRRGEPE